MNAYRAVLVVLVIFMACLLYIAVPRSSEEKIQIGYIGSLSGKYAALGASARDGAILAVEETNKSGGINGCLVELVVCDDGGYPERSVSSIEYFCEKRIKFIIGPFTSECATQVLPLVNNHDVLTIGPLVAGANLYGKDDWFIRLIPSTEAFGRKLAELAVRMGMKNICIIEDLNNRRYCEELSKVFSEVIVSNGMTFSGSIGFYTNGIFSYTKLAREVIDKKADSVLIIASALDTAIVSQKIKMLDKNIQLFSSSWAISKELIENGANAVEGMLFYIPFRSQEDAPSYQHFTHKYRKRFKSQVSYASQFNFEAMTLLAEAIRENGYVSEKVKEDIINKKHPGLAGSFYIDSNGDVRRPLILHTITDCEFVEVPEK